MINKVNICKNLINSHLNINLQIFFGTHYKNYKKFCIFNFLKYFFHKKKAKFKLKKRILVTKTRLENLHTVFA